MSNEYENKFIAAAKEGNAEIVNDYVLRNLSNIDCLHAETGNTALIYAAENGYSQIVESLLGAGSNILIQNRSGNTALMRAATRGHDRVVQILTLMSMTNLDTVNLDCDTAFILSCANGQIQAAETLINGGCNYEVRNNRGETGMDLLRSRYPERIDVVQVTLSITSHILTAN